MPCHDPVPRRHGLAALVALGVLVGGAAIAASVATAARAPALTGTARPGSVLTVAVATQAAQGVPPAITWHRSATARSRGAPIAGATATTYRVSAADAGRYLTACLTGATGTAARTVTACSRPTRMVVPAVTSAPLISGTIATGTVLSATGAKVSGAAGKAAYLWQVSPDGATWRRGAGKGTTALRYRVTRSDVGRQVRLRVIARNAGGASDPAYSNILGVPAGGGPSGSGDSSPPPGEPRTAPQPPQGVTVTPGDGQVSVGWGPPASNGGSAITAYTATAAPGGATCAANAAGTSCTISGLTNGTAYTVGVSATNAAGTSSPATVAVTPRTTPEAPLGITAMPGGGQVSVSWTAPSANGGSAVTGYTATAAPGGGTCTATPPATSCTITGLTNGTAYTVAVSATNVAGTSSPGTVAVTPGLLAIAFAQRAFAFGQTAQVITPTVTGGQGTRTYSVQGTLPAGVTFDQATGAFTGPGATGWNFRATQVSAGYEHTCALTTGGGVKCWGSATGGRLGNGETTGSRVSPVDVTPSGLTFTQVSAGAYHTCAITTAGGVKCWGSDDSGVLGNGAATGIRSSPGDVFAPGIMFTQVSAGQIHTCALTIAGGVKCWGNASFGLLGNGEITGIQVSPVDVTGLTSGVAQVSAGVLHTCALTTGGGVKCWGNAANGRLGNGATTGDQTSPADVNTLTGGVAQVSAGGGGHTCALTTAGAVKCWGKDSNGQLGNGDSITTDQTTPGDVTGLTSGVAQVSAGVLHTCALTTGGGVKCWGNAANGRLGNGASTGSQTSPADVNTLTGGVAQVSAGGGGHTYALATAGALECWGDATDGRLGNGATTGDQTSPADVTSSGPEAGFPATVTVTVADPTGTATTGAFSLTASSPTWIAFRGVTDFAGGAGAQQITPQVTGGEGTRTFSAAGSLPPGVSLNTATGTLTGPAAASWGPRAAQVAVGGYHACFVTTTGALMCMGRNDSGQLGLDTSGADRTAPTAVPDLASGVAQVVAGLEFTCVLTISGAVKCFGKGTDGQLGNGAAATSTSPVQVSGLTTGVTAISAGEAHACALTSAGALKCWGRGANGEIGDGGSAQRTTPTQVTGLTSGVVAVGASRYGGCALMATGTVFCWGPGGNGELGNGGTGNSAVPVAVRVSPGGEPLRGVTAIATGWWHTCAVRNGGALMCWGNGSVGAPATGQTTDQTLPVAVSGLTSGVAQVVAGGEHTCVRMTTGTAKCFGAGSSGRLGNAATGNSTTPVDVLAAPGGSALSGIAAMAAGLASSCLIMDTGEVRCFGSGGWGRLGTGSDANQTTPATATGTGPQAGFPAFVRITATDTVGISSTAQVAVGASAPPALAYPAATFTTGQAAQVVTPTVTGGQGTRTFSVQGTLPTGVTFNTATGAFTGPEASAWNFRASQVSAGSSHTCAVTTGGGVKCWGEDSGGQLGNGDSPLDPSVPRDVIDLTSGVAQVSGGASHTCALTTAGAVKCWGDDSPWGALGNGSRGDSPIPDDVETLGSGVAQISAGYLHTCALLTDGGVRCWGRGNEGQLGQGALVGSHTPVPVSGLGGGVGDPPVAQVSAGGYATCALTTTGAVKCWGSDAWGTLGNGSRGSSSTPDDVETLGSGVAQISAGYSFACALTTTGGVKCWGQDTYGQLGDGLASGGDTHTPVSVSGLGSGVGELPVAEVSVGDYHACAVMIAGAVKCWGVDWNGGLGNGARGPSTTPDDVEDLGSGVAQVTEGWKHTCALITDGAVTCWGHDYFGQLGDGATRVDKMTPVGVAGMSPQAGFPAPVRVTATDARGVTGATSFILGAS